MTQSQNILPTITDGVLMPVVVLGAVRLPPCNGSSGCRRCGVRGTSQLHNHCFTHKNICHICFITYPLANIGVSGKLHDV